MKKCVVLGSIFILLISTYTGLFNDEMVQASGNIIYVGGNNPGNYSSIQAAIDNASSGDTVFVYNGTYKENLKINKSINLTGEDRLITILDGGGGHKVINVSADNVIISGFTIKNSSGGIGIYTGSGVHIEGNNTKIIDNFIIQNERQGIFSNGNKNVVKENSISENRIGVFIHTSKEFLLSNNSISKNDYGINILASDNGNITSNTIEQNINGIYLDADSNFNLINENVIKDNTYGIKSYGYSNLIFYNNFKNNQEQVFDDGKNNWNTSSEGNYWSDYNGIDADGDGIGDTPYVINNDNKDYFPFIRENGWIHKPVADFSWEPLYPRRSQNVYFNASSSYDIDGEIISYEWDFNNDGFFEKTGKITTSSWSSPGNYPVTLRVEDDEGEFSSITKVIIVEPPALLIGNVNGGIGTINVEIKNTYDMIVEDILCNFSVNGGIFNIINFKNSKFVSELKQQEETIIYSDGIIFGFGNIDIDITVNSDNTQGVNKKATGIIFGLYIVIVEWLNS